MARPGNPDLPKQLLEAALTLIDARGEPAFGLRELADSIGYSVTAVYRCYGHREGLLDALRARLATGLALQMGLSDDIDPKPGLRRLGQRFLRWATRYPARFRLMFLARAPDAAVHPVAPLMGGIAGVLRRHRGAEDGAAEVTAGLVMGLLVGLATLAVATGVEAAPPERVLAWFDDGIDSILSGLLDNAKT